MKERYGHDYVCRVGTYTTLQAKGVIKELSRLVNVDEDFHTINRVTSMVDMENNTSWLGIFKSAAKKSQLKGFINRNGDIFRDCVSVIGSIKSSSQHACATIIVPEYEGRDMWSLIPLRKADDGSVISEWEGEDLAKAGYLKEDILSTKQMMKLNHMIDLIERNHGKRYKLEDIPLDDSMVYEYFCKGYTQDVFHFGSDGLTSYLQQLLPQTIHDLIAAIALYRPGAMVMEAHIDYIECKNGQREVEYDYGLEEVLKDTYGNFVFQEQIMRACQVLGGFSLTEADGIRKAMGKKIKDLMDSYKVKFIDGAIERDCPEEDARVIWDKLEKFAGYGFNKSHAAAYAIIGYICNWFKVQYPMEFWTVTLTKADPDSIPSYLAEINNTGNIAVTPPDINLSTDQFVANFENETILWSLAKITQCGPSALTAILDEREKGGEFFSIEEFCERMSEQGRSVKKNTIVNLILSGAFDYIYDIDFKSNISQRKQILKEYFENVRGEKLPLEYSTNSRLYWELQQKQLSKLGTLSLRSALLSSSSAMKSFLQYYKSNDQVLSENCKEKDFVLVAGVVTQVIDKKDKYDRSYADIIINNDGQDLLIRIFADIWMNVHGNFDGWQEQLSQSQGQVLFISGIVSDWRGNRNIQTVSKGSRPSKFDIL